MKEVKKRGALTEKSVISAGRWGGTESRAQRSLSDEEDHTWAFPGCKKKNKKR